MTQSSTPAASNGNSASSQESKKVVYGVFALVAIVIMVIGYGLYQKGGNFLNQLQETSISRGLITFLVAVVTVFIALVIAVWVVASNAKDEVIKERFSYVKDVLATLVGILGTILGFYFGSAEKTTAETPTLAEIQFKSGQVIAHISGGTAPFRYTITAPESDAKGPPQQVSRDGWIFEQVPTSLKSGSMVTIELVDAKDRRASRTTKYQLQVEERDASQAQSSAGQRPVQGAAQGVAQPLPSASATSR